MQKKNQFQEHKENYYYLITFALSKLSHQEITSQIMTDYFK